MQSWAGRWITVHCKRSLRRCGHNSTTIAQPGAHLSAPSLQGLLLWLREHLSADLCQMDVEHTPGCGAIWRGGAVTYSVKEMFYSLQRGRSVGGGGQRYFAVSAAAILWSGREAQRASALCQFCDTILLGQGAGQTRVVQRSLHDAYLDLAAVQHHRLHRCLGEDDGR